MSDLLTLLSRRALEPSRLQPRRPSRYEAEGQQASSDDWQPLVESAPNPMAPARVEPSVPAPQPAPLPPVTSARVTQQQQPAAVKTDEQREPPSLVSKLTMDAALEPSPELQPQQRPPRAVDQVSPPQAISRQVQPEVAPALISHAPLLASATPAGEPAVAPLLPGPRLSTPPEPEAPRPAVIDLPPQASLVAPPAIADNTASRVPVTPVVSEPQPATVVEIHIGRIEFAAPSMPAQPAPARPETATPQVQSLDRYLAAREQGRGRS